MMQIDIDIEMQVLYCIPPIIYALAALVKSIQGR